MERNIAAFILYDKEKRILLQHRSDDAERFPGKWCFFGGGIEYGETALQAVKRECLEELNYKLTKPRLILKTFTPDGDTFYLFIKNYNETKKLFLGEGKAMAWFSLNMIKDLDMIPYEKNLISEVIMKL